MKHHLFILVILAFTCGILAASDAGTPADTFNGQSVGPGLSVDDANAYVDSVVKTQLTKNGSAGSKLDMNAAGGAISDIKRLGIANLVSSYGQTKGDVLYVINATLDRSDEIKRGILEKALSQSATSADIDALLGLYDAHPLILEVLVEHPEWDSDPRVTDFLVAKLDQIPDAYKKSDLAPGYLLTLAARNTSTAVQSKWDSFLTEATTNDSHYSNGHLFINLVTAYMAGLDEWREAIERFLPWVTVHGHDHITPIKNKTLYDTIGRTICVNVGQPHQSMKSPKPLHYCVLDFMFSGNEPSLPEKVKVTTFSNEPKVIPS